MSDDVPIVVMLKAMGVASDQEVAQLAARALFPCLTPPPHWPRPVATEAPLAPAHPKGRR